MATRRQGGPSAGDFTGRTKAAQQKEQLKAAEERSAETTMMAGVDDEAERFGVFDPKSGERINAVSQNVAEFVEDEEEQFPYVRSNGDDFVLTGKESPDELAPLIAARKTHTPPPARVAHKALAKVRVNQDVEKMTYGMVNGEPNNFNLKEGFVYELPYPVAEHLDGLGLVSQWVG